MSSWPRPNLRPANGLRQIDYPPGFRFPRNCSDADQVSGDDYRFPGKVRSGWAQGIRTRDIINPQFCCSFDLSTSAKSDRKRPMPAVNCGAAGLRRSQSEEVAEGEELGSNVLQVLHRVQAYAIGLMALPCPLCPQKRASGGGLLMSALCQKQTSVGT